MKLKELFEKNKDKPFKFIEPGGNAGDYLIYAGAKKLAKEVGLDYSTEDKRNPRIDPDDIIYIHGSGGFISLWDESPRIFRNFRKSYPNNLLIVGPSTASLNRGYLRKAMPRNDPNIIFFARERTTQKVISEFYSQTYLDVDTSLHLTPQDDFFKDFTKGVSIEHKHSLLALRSDLEEVRLPKEIQKRDYDIVCDPTRRPFLEWVELHLKASKITTNRCHSALLGVIIGKDVTMFRNSYHKNRSIWEYCLKERGVNWIGDAQLQKNLGTGESGMKAVVQKYLFKFLKMLRR